MRVTYDPSADIAYISFVDATYNDEAFRSSSRVLCPGGGAIRMDFMPDARLLGIEVTKARFQLPAPLLEAALLHLSSLHADP